jgi:nicotinate phosphoribosyltransferase
MIETTALLTDLYELTMAYSYWKEGLSSTEAVFHYVFSEKTFWRKLRRGSGS